LRGFKITVGGDCSHEIKRCLLLGRKTITNLDSILKSTDITLPTKIHLVKAMVFPVVMYGCESWIIRKAGHQRIYAFELWCWRRLFRVPWTVRRPNQSIVKVINPEYSLEGLMLKLKLQYFGHLMQRTDSMDHYTRAKRFMPTGARHHRLLFLKYQQEIQYLLYLLQLQDNLHHHLQQSKHPSSSTWDVLIPFLYIEMLLQFQ